MKLLSIIKQSNGVSIDTRTILSGQVFFALKGPAFDGNNYVEEAFKKGAVCAVCQIAPKALVDKCIVVDNTLNTLKEVATLHRSFMNIPVIGLTGSNGKTTTKDLLAAIFSKQYLTYATKGNLNNHIGVPLTILNLPQATKMAIIEMGANHKGEIAGLCQIAQPDTAIITSIGKAHLEGFLSLEGVANAKAELFDYVISKKGWLFFHADEFMLKSLTGNYSNQLKISSQFTIRNENYAIRDIHYTPSIQFKLIKNNNKEFNFSSPLYGEYNFRNILLAISVAIHYNIELDNILSAIAAYIPSNNRSQVIKWKEATVFMDAYNANPTSMKLAIEQFANTDYKRKIMILGSMKELGEHTEKEHKEILNTIIQANPDEVFLVGEEWLQISGYPYRIYPSVNEVESLLHSMNLTPDTAILVKGSRSNVLEKLFRL